METIKHTNHPTDQVEDAQPRVLTADEALAVSGGPTIVNDY